MLARLIFWLARQRFIGSYDWLRILRIKSLAWDFYFPYMNRYSNFCHDGLSANSHHDPSFLTEKYFKEDLQNVREFCFARRAENTGEFHRQIADILQEFWQFSPAISREVERKIINFKNKLGGEPYIAIHVRRGDKLREDDRLYEIEEYISILTDHNKHKKIRNVFVLTDDFRAYSQLKEALADAFVFSFVTKQQRGYDESVHDFYPLAEKHKRLVDFLVDIEIARHSDFFIGSFTSNLFRLVCYFKRGNDCFDLSGDFANPGKNAP